VFQTLGWATPNNRRLIERCSRIVTVLLIAAYISIPIMILLGVVESPLGGM
jgi:hypothetical protein